MRWLPPVTIAAWVLGIAWTVGYYIDPTLPVINALGNLNLLIGLALLLLALILTIVTLVTRSSRKVR